MVVLPVDHTILSSLNMSTRLAMAGIEFVTLFTNFAVQVWYTFLRGLFAHEAL